MIAGAGCSIGWNASAAIGSSRSSGRPSGSTTRPSSPGPDRHARDFAGRRDQRADADLLALVEDRRVDRLGLERQRVAHPPALEAQELAEPRLRQAGHLRDPVGDRLHPSDRLGLGLEINARQRLALGREPVGTVNAGRRHDGSVPRRCG